MNGTLKCEIATFRHGVRPKPSSLFQIFLGTWFLGSLPFWTLTLTYSHSHTEIQTNSHTHIIKTLFLYSFDIKFRKCNLLWLGMKGQRFICSHSVWSG